MNLPTMKNTNLTKASISELWKLVALGVAELAKRKCVAIRRVNGGEPQATLTVALESQRPGVPPLLVVGNATLNEERQHHYEAFTVDAATVARINRHAYRENSSGVPL
jgi:hypothetical protein